MKTIYLGLLASAAAILVGAARSGPPNATDITRSHGFKNARMCTFRPAGEKLFDGLNELKFKKSLRLTREIGGLDLAIDGRRSSIPDPSSGSDEAGSTVATPVRPVKWHGLPVRSFVTGHSQAAESDLQYWREVRLDASPTQVRAALRRLGANVPAGGYQSIEDDHPCGGAISVGGKKGSATLRCGWGC